MKTTATYEEVGDLATAAAPPGRDVESFRAGALWLLRALAEDRLWYDGLDYTDRVRDLKQWAYSDGELAGRGIEVEW